MIYGDRMISTREHDQRNSHCVSGVFRKRGSQDMAAIAKFISYDGGIAFSEKAMKMQKRDQDAVIVPLDDVVSVNVRRPQEDTEGFVRIDLADGKRYRIFFEDDQLREAVQFKKQFDATVSDFEDDFPSGPVQQKAIAPRPARQAGNNDVMQNGEYPAKAPKKPFYKRWWVWVIFAVLVVAIIGAIAGGRSDNKTDASGGQSVNAPQPAAPADVPAASEQTGAVDVGDYTVEIKDAIKTTDFEGNPAIVITYTWTNNSADTTSAMASLLGKAFQDGIQLDSAIIGNDEVYNIDLYMTEIRPGVSLDIQEAFVLKSDSIVEFEVSDWLSFADPATKNFDPNDL